MTYPETRVCKHHGIQPISEYYFDPKKWWRCRSCLREKKRLWRKNNPEKHLASLKRHRERYPDQAKETNRRYRQNNKERQYQRGKDYRSKNKTKYRESMWKHMGINITYKKYEEILLKQGGKCAICFSNSPGKRVSWAVDHNHKTGDIRGLLCRSCNIGIGCLKDDPVVLESARLYLLKNV